METELARTFLTVVAAGNFFGAAERDAALSMWPAIGVTPWQSM